MKIKKNIQLQEQIEVDKKIVEDVEETSDEDIALDDILDASVSEIADAVQDAAEEASDGKEVYSDSKAETVAKEIKTHANGFDAAAWAPLDVQSELTDKLDDCLSNAMVGHHMGTHDGVDLLVCGLPGSGKTGITKQWAKDRGVNLFYLNAKNDDLGAILNGFPVDTTEETEDGRTVHTVTRSLSKSLDDLDKKRSVLFLDEFNRAPQSLRASLLKLINEHKAVGKGKDGMHRFENLLFTIACINPSIPTDPGAIPLNDAERSRFLYQPGAWDSDKKEARKYLAFFFKKVIAELDKASPDYVALYKEYMNAYNMAMYLLKHREFKFDSKADLQNLYDYECKMFNQRDLTNALIAEGGTKERFLLWVDRDSNYLPKNKQMLHDILDSWVPPVVMDPTDAVTPNTAGAPEQSPASSNAKPNLSGSFDDIFGAGGSETDPLLGNSGGVVTVTADQARQRLSVFDFTL